MNQTVKARAYVNIALIKYWGKKDEYYNLPNQSSISFTVDGYYTDSFAKIADADNLAIDGVISDKFEQDKIHAWLNKLRKIYGFKEHLSFDNYNHVPFKAGLASSASSYAAMSLAINELLKLNLSKEDLSKMARIGSGSASRSIYGGFVTWECGNDHSNSYAKKLAISWPEFRILIVENSQEMKKTSSRDAMKLVNGLKEYHAFLKQSELDYEMMLKELPKKDIWSIGSIAEKNAELLHKTINASGINYFNDDTYKITNIIQKLRNDNNIPAFFTIDAGPNVKIITTSQYVSEITNQLSDYKVLVMKQGADAYVQN